VRVPFKYNDGGYATLNFVPSLATMIFGLLAGELVRARLKAASKIGVMVGAAAAGLAAGWLLDRAGLCPIVKRIWTPSWTLFSAGWAFLLLAVFYAIIDVAKWRAWTGPLVVVGMNSIAIYCISMLLKPWFRESLKRHTWPDVYSVFGAVWAPMMEAGLFLLFVWLVAWWLYRQKAFLRI
jgi:predicted acyltransferase